MVGSLREGLLDLAQPSTGASLVPENYSHTTINDRPSLPPKPAWLSRILDQRCTPHGYWEQSAGSGFESLVRARFGP